MAGCAMSSPPQSLEGSFFVRSGTVSPSRPAIPPRRRAQPRSRLAARPPPQAARSGLDGGEHGAMLPRVGRTSTPPPTQLLEPLSAMADRDCFVAALLAMTGSFFLLCAL